MQIRNVIFDFGGVLIDWNPRYLYRKVFDNDEQMEYFLDNICTTEWNTCQDAGRPWSDAVALLQKQYPEYSELIALYSDRWPEMLGGAFPETVSLMRRVKEAGYHVFGLTNWSAEKFPVALERFDFLKELEGIVVSGEEKLIKPDERIYRVLFDRYKQLPEESVFIDDNQANITAAERLGMHAVLFDNIESVEKRLKQLLGDKKLK